MEEGKKAGALLDVRGLRKYFELSGGQRVHAVERVSFSLESGRTLGIVGESGCGKSTLARTIIRIYEPTEGQIYFQGQEITRLSQRSLQPLRKDVQMIFQDPFSSLNPRLKARASVAEPLARAGIPAAQRRARAEAMLATVGLEGLGNRYPHEFSGGQRQRIAVARAIVTTPDLVVCDEPVSALDASVQAQVLNLLRDVQEKFGLAYLFISHDLRVVAGLCREVALMADGVIAARGRSVEELAATGHPVIEELLASLPPAFPRR